MEMEWGCDWTPGEEEGRELNRQDEGKLRGETMLRGLEGAGGRGKGMDVWREKSGREGGKGWMVGWMVSN